MSDALSPQALLEGFQACLDETEGLLADMNAAMERRDAESISGIASSLAEKLDQVAGLEGRRRKMLTDSGRAADSRESMKEWLEDQDPRLQAQWKLISQSLQRIQAEVGRQKLVTEKSKQFVESALDLLTGRDSRHNLYDQSGEFGSTARLGRDLGKA